MAKLKNLDSIWTAPQGVPVTVGHNRTIENESAPGEPPRFVCRLHGHPVARIVPLGDSGAASVVLAHGGYMTHTTRQAMGDFCLAFGIRAGVSFARDTFNVSYVAPDGETRELADERGTGVLRFIAARFPT